MNDYELWFANANLSYMVKLKLLNKFKSVEKIWYYSIQNKKDNIFNTKMISALEKAWDKNKINFIKEKLVNEDIKTVVITDKLYPERLKVYEDSPYMLFYKGDIKKINYEHNVAVVGARECTNYGANVTNLICQHLCKNNINIISGLARGIDTLAHSKCINMNSYTCAVLGSGIDVVYPKQNLNLYHDISKNGCIISQFMPGIKPFSYNFPIRNRIISALSDLVIVIEGNEKSGSLITASSALDQGKDVIAVPGNVFSQQSKGTNKLIKDGAYVFTEIKDIYDILNIQDIKQPHIISSKMSCIEKEVYENIGNTPVHIDQIINLTQIDIRKLYEVLFDLKLKEQVICLSGNYYVRNNNKI
ncbi:DNA-processing protein DprA [Clostridium aestuarii]|uniref:DNA-processing protein DprA n=1 Tax=Clostridium aestuarii TaxID=338193 RepID=A0ABT4CY94_9CLOT|nr:DNA-processing protein DprA [Clostridium aestuarii]MCY6483948.1 DNA-processing protein DprA [Clostridium aestuarii]